MTISQERIERHHENAHRRIAELESALQAGMREITEAEIRKMIKLQTQNSQMIVRWFIEELTRRGFKIVKEEE